MRVPVVDSAGRQLLPCTPPKARHLLKQGQARARRCKLGIFYIQLVYEVPEPSRQQLVVSASIPAAPTKATALSATRTRCSTSWRKRRPMLRKRSRCDAPCDERGVIADVWTMNLDGTDQRQLTDFGAMSWAPYIHPSGRYVIFASNKLGFENFELFLVDIDGTKEPVRVTYSDGFDGLPVPSPDGRRLAWSSTRSGGDGGQLFLAEWNHAKALEAIKAAPPRASRN